MPTISERICRQLADDIITGVMAPGEKLDEKNTAERYGVSRTPVREAFRQLAATGLIESRPHKGVTVTKLDMEQLTDMFEALGEIEALCAKFSAQRMSVVERKQLEKIHQRSQMPLQAQADGTYSDSNEQFHRALHLGSHNAALESLAQDLWRTVSPFRRTVFFQRENRMAASFDEHEEIVAAILAGDPERAYHAVHSHVAQSTLNAIAYFETSENG